MFHRFDPTEKVAIFFLLLAGVLALLDIEGTKSAFTTSEGEAIACSIESYGDARETWALMPEDC